MNLITVAGPPSSGKTSLIIHLAKSMAESPKTETSGAMHGQKKDVRVIKFDCLSSNDKERYEKAGIHLRTGLAGNLCPDHFFVNNIEKGVQWAAQEGGDVLITESAGLCNRCSPHLKDIPALCVIDALSGLGTPQKIGPMLRFADIVVVTKGDIISQAEREVFAFRVKQASPKAQVLAFNGLTGQGVHDVRSVLESLPAQDFSSSVALRFSMPTALCSYCLGEKRVGQDFQIGITRDMSWS